MHKYNYNSTNFQKIANNLIIQLAFYSISNSNVYIQILPLNCIYWSIEKKKKKKGTSKLKATFVHFFVLTYFLKRETKSIFKWISYFFIQIKLLIYLSLVVRVSPFVKNLPKTHTNSSNEEYHQTKNRLYNSQLTILWIKHIIKITYIIHH